VPAPAGSGYYRTRADQLMSYTIGIVGNPNSGKTTLFNALTGSHQKVGNWPGVTVERKTGQFQYQGEQFELVDLPGTYSLTNTESDTAIDESIACDYILSQQADVIINVVDATNLERNLFITTQLMEMGVPIVLAVNMMDVAKRRRLKIDLAQLSQLLGCPVVGIVANKHRGMDALIEAIHALCHAPTVSTQRSLFSKEIQEAIEKLSKDISRQHPEYTQYAKLFALRLLEDDQTTKNKLGPGFEHTLGEDSDILIFDARFGFAHDIAKKVLSSQQGRKQTITHQIDNIVLNPYLGIPIFFAVMYLLFVFAINIGGVFQDFFDIFSDTLLVKGVGKVLLDLHSPSWLVAILAMGVGKGLNTTMTFIPVIGAMFMGLAFLEASGYMARAAFVMDRFMGALGLPGKAFVPLIIGFGCNVPAIMATRTIERQRDRILTVMMSPFMSCGARLAIYAMFTSAFFPVGGQNVVFALYLIGIIAAVVTGWLLRHTILPGEPSPLVLELPSYHLPTFRAIWQQGALRLKRFIFRAGKVIVPVCIVLGFLNSLVLDGSTAGVFSMGDAHHHSLLSQLGRLITPIFAPMGMSQDNWPATVGLLTGALAKEVVVATLNTLYMQAGHITPHHLATVDIWHGIQQAFASIIHNIQALPQALGNPIAASAPENTVIEGVYGQMYQRFNGQAGATAAFFIIFITTDVSTID